MAKPLVFEVTWFVAVFAPHIRSFASSVGSHHSDDALSGFYEFYQIVQADESDDDDAEESESERKGESRGRTVGLHSPWGMIWSICEATGWTYEYVMDGVSWINIKMMLADAPKHIRIKKKKSDEEFLDSFCES